MKLKWANIQNNLNTYMSFYAFHSLKLALFILFTFYALYAFLLFTLFTLFILSLLSQLLFHLFFFQIYLLNLNLYCLLIQANYNTISLSRHEQVLTYHVIIILAHDVINVFYYEYWTDEQKYFYVYRQIISIKRNSNIC